MHIFFGLMAFLSVVLYASPAPCHGVAGYVEAAQGYRITALYDDGEPMSYAAVEIKAPGEAIAFQTGRTDRNGIMLFQPDHPGHWQAVVTDGMGHRLALGLEVASAGAPADAGKQAAGDKTRNIITGLAVIFGLFGILYGRKGRRSPPLASSRCSHIKTP